MSVLETALVYGAIPLGIVVFLALLVFGPSAARAPRYRPGRPWDYEPVWYLPHPVSGTTTEPGGHPAVAAGPARGELSAGPDRAPREHVPASVLDAPVTTARGGAHGSW